MAEKSSPSTAQPHVRRSDLAARITRCAARADEYGLGSVMATRLAIDAAKQIAVDAAELVASLEERYEAIKDMPVGIAGNQR